MPVVFFVNIAIIHKIATQHRRALLMGKNAKKKKAEDKKPVWEIYSSLQYRDVIDGLVHFSKKAVNTTAGYGGVRLPPRDPVDIPFVCASTRGIAELMMDYSRGAADGAAWKQINDAMMGFTERYSNPPSQDEVDAIVKLMSEANPGVIGDTSDPNLKQIFMVGENMGDVPLLPLHSAPFAALFADLEGIHWDKVREVGTPNERPWLPPYESATIMVGGSNCQNAGGLIYKMRKVMFFAPPRESMDMRIASRYFHVGVSPLDRRAARRFLLDIIEVKRNASLSEQIERRVRGLVRLSVERGQKARQLILNSPEAFGIDGDALPISPSCPVLSAGLVCHELRNKEWRCEYAQYVFDLLHKPVHVDGDQKPSPVTADDHSRVIRAVIEEIL